jgi:hypothetical protein
MALNFRRKGVFFTIISLTLLGILLFSFTTFYQYRQKDKFSVVETRIESMDKLLLNLEKDMEKGVYIASFRALIAMEEYIANEGSFMDDLDLRFEELFLNGTLYGNSSFMMENNTFSNWTQKMQEQAQLMDITFGLAVNNITLFQDSAWTVKVMVNSSVSLSDTKGVAQWVSNKSVTATIDITGFDDPLYAAYTGNAIIKKINRTIYEGDYVTGNDTTNLELHMNNTLYTEFDRAPSFLMRFENNITYTNSSPYGIESLVNKDEIALYHSCPASTSSVDYLYWDCSSEQGFSVAGMPASFRLDNQSDFNSSLRRPVKYEVEGLMT